jgi:hypothetical protein
VNGERKEPEARARLFWQRVNHIHHHTSNMTTPERSSHSRSTSQKSPQFENIPYTLPPLPLASDQFVDDIFDIDDSGSDDDFSPVLDAIAVSSITALWTSFISTPFHSPLDYPNSPKL